MNKISNRIKHTKITHGYCLICGTHGKLSIDHVPPQGSVTITRVEQRHMCEMIGVKATSIKGVPSPNGSKFRTICNKCNSEILGSVDSEVSSVSKNLTLKIKDYFENFNNIYNSVSVDINALNYARAMVGHVLSATSVTECREPSKPRPYFSPLQDFVLGNDEALNETHDLYFWFYPRNRHVSAKYVQFYNEGHSAGISLLAFYPLAFLITPKNAGIYPAHAQKFELSMSKLALSLSSHNMEYLDFPFMGLQGNSMYLLYEHQAIISYPVKNVKV
jgi:hypothetical protein